MSISSFLYKKSIISKRILFGKEIFIKRDDLVNIDCISGNKIRKLEYLRNQLQNKLAKYNISSNSESSASSAFETTVIGSYGGYQSNAMLAIAKLSAIYKHCEFVYFTKNIPDDLLKCPVGNLKSALECGMKLYVIDAKDYSTLTSLPKTITSFPYELLNKSRSSSSIRPTILKDTAYDINATNSTVVEGDETFHIIRSRSINSNSNNDSNIEKNSSQHLNQQSLPSSNNFSDNNNDINSYNISTSRNTVDYLWIPQGVCMQEAEVGIRRLMKEMLDFIVDYEQFNNNNKKKNKNGDDDGELAKRKPWKIIFAGGTGTMALFTARHLSLLLNGYYNNSNESNSISNSKGTFAINSCCTSDDNDLQYQSSSITSVSLPLDIQVVVVPCVSTAESILHDMRELDGISGDYQIFPAILEEISGTVSKFTDASTTTTAMIKSLNVSTNTQTKTSRNDIGNINSSGSGSNKARKGTFLPAKYKFGKPSKQLYDIWFELRKQIISNEKTTATSNSVDNNNNNNKSSSEQNTTSISNIAIANTIADISDNKTNINDVEGNHDNRATTMIDFDLIYAPRSFQVLLQHGYFGNQLTEKLSRNPVKVDSDTRSNNNKFFNMNNSSNHNMSNCDISNNTNNNNTGTSDTTTSYNNSSCSRGNNDYNILYYHCGGVEGNESQLTRYKDAKIT